VLVGLSQLRGEETPEGLAAALAALGRRRAGQGVPLPEVLLAFQVGAHRFWEHLVRLAPEEPEERLDVLQVATTTMLELLQHAVGGRVGGAVGAYLPGEEIPQLDGIEGAGLAPAAEPEAAARRARAASRAAVHLGRPMVRYEDVVPLAAVLGGPEEERVAFVNTWLGPVIADGRGEELVRSLTEFYASGMSLAAAARALYVHRHTL